jgi:hypothetical protein
MAFLGRIYRIDFADGYFYIGSTKHSLETRLKEHRQSRLSNLKATLESNYPIRSRFDIYLSKYGWNNPTISLIEEHLISSTKELTTLEYALINKVYDNEKNMNDKCPGRPRLYTGGKITSLS